MLAVLMFKIARRKEKLKQKTLLSNETLFSVHVTRNFVSSRYDLKTEEVGTYFWFHIFYQKSYFNVFKQCLHTVTY